MKYRNKQPFTGPRFEGRGNRGAILPAWLRGWLDQTDPRITAAQWPSHFALKFVDCLNGVPTGRPEEWDQRRWSRLGTGLHGEREGRIRVVRRPRFMHADIGEH